MPLKSTLRSSVSSLAIIWYDAYMEWYVRLPIAELADYEVGVIIEHVTIQ